MCLLFEDEGEAGVHWPLSLVFLALCSGCFFSFLCRGAYRDDDSGSSSLLFWLRFCLCSVDFSTLDSVFLGCVSALFPCVLGFSFGPVRPLFFLAGFLWLVPLPGSLFSVGTTTIARLIHVSVLPLSFLILSVYFFCVFMLCFALLLLLFWYFVSLLL